MSLHIRELSFPNGTWSRHLLIQTFVKFYQSQDVPCPLEQCGASYSELIYSAAAVYSVWEDSFSLTINITITMLIHTHGRRFVLCIATRYSSPLIDSALFSFKCRNKLNVLPNLNYECLKVGSNGNQSCIQLQHAWRSIRLEKRMLICCYFRVK